MSLLPTSLNPQYNISYKSNKDKDKDKDNKLFSYSFVHHVFKSQSFVRNASRHLKMFEHAGWGPYEKNLHLFLRRSQILQKFYNIFQKVGTI